ncbi:hypothetical protein G8767_33400 [Rhodococcus sp. IC4_135]|uniref:Acb2/Tad1 domain-containing protein n=1 Tax=Rhodococcus sp. IC4_135 TaxID=2715537 RepID=UPI0014243480|nr:hypothetical protein [Rhodococcus sp. IC4_135]
MTDGTLIGWMLKTITERIHEELPAGRERSLALTKLEEADMWLGRAIASGADK